MAGGVGKSSNCKASFTLHDEYLKVAASSSTIYPRVCFSAVCDNVLCKIPNTPLRLYLVLASAHLRAFLVTYLNTAAALV